MKSFIYVLLVTIGIYVICFGLVAYFSYIIISLHKLKEDVKSIKYMLSIIIEDMNKNKDNDI